MKATELVANLIRGTEAYEARLSDASEFVRVFTPDGRLIIVAPKQTDVAHLKKQIDCWREKCQ